MDQLHPPTRNPRNKGLSEKGLVMEKGNQTSRGFGMKQGLFLSSSACSSLFSPMASSHGGFLAHSCAPRRKKHMVGDFYNLSNCSHLNYCNTRSPLAPFCPYLAEGSPGKIDYRKKGTLILTSLMEDLEHMTARLGSFNLTFFFCGLQFYTHHLLSTPISSSG